MESRADELIITLYEERPVLWDSRLKSYFNRDLRRNALEEMAKALKTDVKHVKKKIHSLRTSFTNEKRKLFKKRNGQCDTNWKPSQKFVSLQFLDPVCTPNVKTHSEIETEEEMESVDCVAYDQVKMDEMETNPIDEALFTANISDTSSLKSTAFRSKSSAYHSTMKRTKNKRSYQQTVENEDSAIDAILKFLQEQNTVQSELIKQVQNDSLSTFSKHLDCLLKDFPKGDREEFEAEILVQAYAKKKKLRQKRDY